MQGLCYVSTDLWQQRAKLVEGSERGDTEDVPVMNDNLVYDSCDKGKSSLSFS